MASAVIRMQDLTNIIADVSQPLDRAVDVGAFGVVNLQTHRVKLPTVGPIVLHFDHSMTLEDSAFEPTGFFVTFTNGGATTPVTVTIPNPNRYLRWRSATTGGTYPIQFMIDMLGRER